MASRNTGTSRRTSETLPPNACRNAAGNSVTVINVNTSGTLSTFVEKTLTTGAEPWNVVASPDGTKVFVANSGQDTITVINTATRQIIEYLAGQFQPRQNNSIVLVSSAASTVIAAEQSAGYHVAKAGLNQLARYYAVVLGAKGIRVNVVAPGTVLKPENQAFYLQNKKLQRLFRKTIPLGRMGTAAEIAEVIAFLSGPRASFVTGQTLLVDGGVNLLSTETLARTLAG